MSNRPHLLPLTVYWEDTDAAGIVYYANYLKFLERGRSEMVRAAGLDQFQLLSRDGLVFAVKRCLIDYLVPAVLGDRLTVVTRIATVRGASLDLDQTVCRGETDLVRAELKLACLSREGKPTRLPAEVKRLFDDLAGDGGNGPAAST